MRNSTASTSPTQPPERSERRSRSPRSLGGRDGPAAVVTISSDLLAAAALLDGQGLRGTRQGGLGSTVEVYSAEPATDRQAATGGATTGGLGDELFGVAGSRGSRRHDVVEQTVVLVVVDARYLLLAMSTVDFPSRMSWTITGPPPEGSRWRRRRPELSLR